MKHVDEYRDPVAVKELARKITEISHKPARFMEVCGTHTVALFRHGIRDFLPDRIELISGPGCPVCVTSSRDIDRAIAVAEQDGVTVATFGDMLRVPGSKGSLAGYRAAGADVRIVYSTLDAVKLAKESLDLEVVFVAVGFETTAPTVAGAIKAAAIQGLENFSVLVSHKLLPPAMDALLGAGEIRLDGFLLPGHVTTIIGPAPYRPLAEKYRTPCVISGFEPVDILQAIMMLVEQVEAGSFDVGVQYLRAVGQDGNPGARAVLCEVFEPADAEWRGLGVIPGSGLAVREEFAQYDATRRHGIDAPPVPDPPGCKCGEVLRGVMPPPDCALFGDKCTPGTPVGPCMVSSEGSCAAYYKYGPRK